MPKKTKKQKLLAQIHRSRIPNDSRTSVTDSPNAPVSQVPGYSLRLPNNHTEINSRNAQAAQTLSTRNVDLLKTVVITTIILVAEILLSRLLK